MKRKESQLKRWGRRNFLNTEWALWNTCEGAAKRELDGVSQFLSFFSFNGFKGRPGVIILGNKLK